MKKSFVSLFFTPKKLQVLQLNAKKNAVEKFTTVDLPERLIVNYKIEDKKRLIAILQEIWKRLRLKEKSVGIIVPEFSTFTKSLILPQLDTLELDEAVRWQSRDFLLSGNGKMVMDWKVVQKQKESLQILAVAMQEDLLLSFVDAAGEAGFFPLVVETPSLSLVRISDHDPTSKLVIYANFGEAVIVLAKGEEIFCSSVIGSADQNGILWTAKRMIEHYSNIQVSRVQIGGLDLTQELVGRLQETFGKSVDWIQVNIVGLSSQQVQEYIVPLSLQFKDPAEPLNETTINLLPLNWVKHYQDKKVRLQVFSLLLFVSIIIWGCFLATLGVRLALSRQINVFHKNNIARADVLPKALVDQVDQVNKLSDKVVKITDATNPFQEVVNMIIDSKPKGVIIFEFQIDLDTGKILLKGQAVDRQVLIDFKQALEENKTFSKVSIPFSNLETGENLEFTMRFNYGVVVAKKPIKIPIK